jgi:hypothetical protein
MLPKPFVSTKHVHRLNFERDFENKTRNIGARVQTSFGKEVDLNHPRSITGHRTIAINCLPRRSP